MLLSFNFVKLTSWSNMENSTSVFYLKMYTFDKTAKTYYLVSAPLAITLWLNF